MVDLKSFSKAARAVFLAQASVSERIATLENMVGVKLLDRLGRQVTPTQAGELLYKHAVLLLDMKKTACLEMQDYLGIKRGDIALGGSTIPGEYILPRVLGIFCRTYTQVSMRLSVADSASIERGVMDGTFELGVIGTKAMHKTLVCRDLWADKLVLAVPRDHPWAERSTVTIAGVEGRTLYFPGTGLRNLHNFRSASA